MGQAASTPLRGIPASRAYWELKAEQMMNRIFDPEPAIDLDEHQDCGDGSESLHLPAPAPLARRHPLRPTQRNAPHHSNPSVLLLSTLGGVCMVSAASTLLYLNHSNQAQQSLQQERNLLLVERLRSLGPANPTPLSAPHASEMTLPRQQQLAAAAAETLPPPPEEAWIQELDQLPQPPSSQPQVLRVPVSSRLAAAAPAARRGGSGGGGTSGGPAAVPLLVGVVGAPGQAGSAIFQMGGSSTSASVGEAIGNSGWRLRSANGDTAEIERGGEVKQVSIGNGG
jgi:hypothetical protein